MTPGSLIALKIRGRALLVATIACAALMGCESSTRFDRDAWLKTPDAARHRMVADLIERKLLPGLTHDQVEALLGPPSFDSSEYVTYIVDSGGVLDIRFAAAEPRRVDKVFTREM